MTELARTLRLRDLVLFNVAAIVGLRWLSVAAAGGATSVTLWLLAMALFFIPQACAVIDLTRRMPEEGGVYIWTRTAFGEVHGFVAGWCYWTNNLVYFPSLLVYVAGISVFVAGSGHQALGEQRGYVVTFSALALLLVAAANVFGLRTGKWIHNVGGIGTWITGGVLVVLGVLAATRLGLASPLGPASFVSGIVSLDKLSFWAAICFAFAGLELSSVLAGEVVDAERTIPRAVVTSGLAIASIYVLGTLALLVALPHEEISVVSGILQAIAAVSERLGVGWLTGPLALLVTLGGLGGLMAWFTGAARMAFVAGIDRFLPAGFARIHPRYGTPYVAVTVQAAVAMAFVLMSFVGASVQEAYLVLLDTCVLVYFVPYVYLFASYLRIRWQGGDPKAAFPRTRPLATALGATGLVTTMLAMAMAVVPPQGAASGVAFVGKTVGGFVAFLVAGACIYLYETRRGGGSSAHPGA
jgi:glutamate:GABA antiporter